MLEIWGETCLLGSVFSLAVDLLINSNKVIILKAKWWKEKLRENNLNSH